MDDPHRCLSCEKLLGCPDCTSRSLTDFGQVTVLCIPCFQGRMTWQAALADLRKQKELTPALVTMNTQRDSLLRRFFGRVLDTANSIMGAPPKKLLYGFDLVTRRRAANKKYGRGQLDRGLGQQNKHTTIKSMSTH